MRALPRLRRWYAKALYILVSIAIYYVLGGLAPTSVSRGILRSVLVFLLVLLATRVFRSVVEPDDSPRPFWQMTGAPLAGFILGAIFGLGAILLAVYDFGVETTANEKPFRADEPYVVVSALLLAILSVLYLTSSVRLRAIAKE